MLETAWQQTSDTRGLTLTLCSKLLVLAELTMPRVHALLPSFSMTLKVFQYLQIVASHRSGFGFCKKASARPRYT